MPYRFIAPAADACDAMMGLWRQRLAPLPLDSAGLAGCAWIADIGYRTSCLALTALDRVSRPTYYSALAEALLGRNNGSRMSAAQGNRIAIRSCQT
jgi:hypothetical protein